MCRVLPSLKERYCFTIWLSQTRRMSAASSPSLSQILRSGRPASLCNKLCLMCNPYVLCASPHTLCNSPCVLYYLASQEWVCTCCDWATLFAKATLSQMLAGPTSARCPACLYIPIWHTNMACNYDISVHVTAVLLLVAIPAMYN